MANAPAKKPKGPMPLSPTEDAAVLLMSLGEDRAAAVMKHLGPKEVQLLGATMASLHDISKEQVDSTLTNFIQTVDKKTSLGVGSSEYVKKVLVKALGEEKAGGLIDRILMGTNSKGLEQLKWLEPKVIAEMIRLEHPQIISIVLAYLDSDQSAAVLAEMPERVRHDIIMRIAALEGIQPAALKELDMIMEKQFAGKQRLKSSSVGGVRTAAEIMNFMESTMEGAIMDQIGEADPELSDAIQDLMFVFENLKEVDDRGMQTLLREISTDSLVLALKGADEELKDKFFRNLSKRAAEMLADDLEAKGPVKVSEVETAQKEILAVAKRLSDEGQIALGGAGGEEYI